MLTRHVSRNSSPVTCCFKGEKFHLLCPQRGRLCSSPHPSLVTLVKESLDKADRGGEETVAIKREDKRTGIILKASVGLSDQVLYVCG